MSAPGFKTPDLRAALKLIREAAFPLSGITFPPSGGFQLLIGSPEAGLPSPANEWDDVLGHADHTPRPDNDGQARSRQAVLSPRRV